MTKTRYPLLVQVLVAGPAIIGAVFVFMGCTLARREPLVLFLAVAGLIAIFVTIFQMPTGLTVASETVTVSYLGGLTQSFDRQHMRVRIIGFAPGTLHITATDRSWRSRLIGSFKLNLAFIAEREELLRELGIADPFQR